MQFQYYIFILFLVLVSLELKRKSRIFLSKVDDLQSELCDMQNYLP
jgi:hypothetical protein